MVLLKKLMVHNGILIETIGISVMVSIGLLLFFLAGYLLLRESRRNTINAVTAFGGECCCLRTQACKTIIQKYFDDRLAQAFQNDHNNL